MMKRPRTSLLLAATLLLGLAQTALGCALTVEKNQTIVQHFPERITVDATGGIGTALVHNDQSGATWASETQAEQALEGTANVGLNSGDGGAGLGGAAAGVAGGNDQRITRRRIATRNAPRGLARGPPWKHHARPLWPLPPERGNGFSRTRPKQTDSTARTRPMTHTLASADNASTLAIWIAVGGIFGELIIGVVLVRISAALGRVDKLEGEVKAYANELIETKHAQVLDAIERIEQRLASGDQRFSKLNQHDHDAELQLVRSFEELRRYVVENCATSGAQLELRKELEGLKLAVTRLQEAA